MVSSKDQNKAISISTLVFSIHAPLQGTTLMTPGPSGTVYGYYPYILPSVNTNVYTTIYSVSYSIEDVGNLEILDINLFSDFAITGNGAMRWQISGDGGNTWITMSEGSFDTGGVEGYDYIIASGLWISTIESLDNKLQLRIQGLANVGTVDFTIYNDNLLTITYRKKVLF